MITVVCTKCHKPLNLDETKLPPRFPCPLCKTTLSVDLRSVERHEPPEHSSRSLAALQIMHSALARYSVAPLPPELPPEPQPVNVGLQDTDFWENGPYLGCLLSVLVIVVVLVKMGMKGWITALVGGSIAGFASLGVIGLLMVISKASRFRAQRRQQWEHGKQTAREASDREARDTTSSLRSLLVTSAELRDGLFESLARARNALDTANREHKARVIPTFWDAVEGAAAALGAYDHLLRRLVSNAQQYYKRLELRQHTFPPFPYVSTDLPSEEDMVKLFRQVVRLGQSDYQFANIWEQRRTREAISTGFGSLEQAVRAVGSNIAGAIADVQMSLDSGFDRLVDSQLSSGAAIRSTLESVAQSADAQRREVVEVLRSQNSKLDNIQWRRKPLGSRYLRE